MKTILFLSCWMVFFLAMSGCEKPEKYPGIKSNAEMQKPVSDSLRLKVIENWQKFRKDSGESLLSAGEKLDRLGNKINDPNAREKVKLRRIYNASEYNLDKLRTKLMRQGIKFRTAIGHYTHSDVLKNESFRTDFTAKLCAIHNDLDQALSINP